MSQVIVYEQTDPFGNVVEMVTIENDDGSNTSMTKAEYDKEQLPPIPTE